MKENLRIKAAGFAKRKHANQLDDNNEDYYFAHLLPVALIVSQVSKSDNVVAAAYLHDTLEDTETTFEELVKEFNLTIANLVYEVTHELSDKGNYFPRLKSREAILIKFADRLSNLSRMQSWNEQRQNHYLRRSKFWKNAPEDKIIEGQK